jgi:hypothetical protein
MKQLKIRLLFQATLLVCAVQVQSQCNLDLAGWSKLKQDQILDEKLIDSNSVAGLRVCFLIQGNREEIWGMLTDYENFDKIYGGIDSLRVLSENKTGARVEIFQSTILKNLNYVLIRDYVKEGYHLSWIRDSGDLEIIYGSWLIEDSSYPDKLLVTYTNFFRYGGIVPDKIPRNWAIKQVRFMAENARKWLDENRDLYQ